MQSSGFFNSEIDQSTGTYDLEYYASQFADYFALFVGNGVFGSPTNQLKVSAGEGLNVVVSTGWAFIDGYWYHNDEELELVIPPNATSQIRTDSVKCRLDFSTRKILTAYYNGDVDVVRDGTYYDLKLAEVIIPVAATQVLESNITDTRINEDVCGLVTGLLEVQTTKDLFAQYQAMFDEWFDGIKDKLGSDPAGNLQIQIDEVKENVDNLEVQVLDNTESLKNVLYIVSFDAETGTLVTKSADYVEENGYAT